MLITLEVSRLVARFLGKIDPTGVDRVSLAYVRFFNSIGADLQRPVRALVRSHGMTGIFSPACSRELFEILLLGHRVAADRMWPCLWRGISTCILHINGRRDLLLVTAHQQVETHFFGLHLLWHGVKPIYFLHDVIPLTHPQYCRPSSEMIHQRRLKRMLTGVGLISNSQQTTQQLMRFAGNLYPEKVDLMPPLLTAGLAIRFDEPFSNKANTLAGRAKFAKAPVDSSQENCHQLPYFICLGTIEPRKNHSLLLRVWRELLASHPIESIPQLRVIGQTGWDCIEIEQEMLDSSWHHGKVEWLRSCSDDELADQLMGCRALLFPSHVEGFGLPLAEALAAGVPAIVSDLPVFREFAGLVPEYLDPTDAREWLRAVVSYAESVSQRRDDQLHRMSDWHPPSWDAHFEKLMPWLEQLWRRQCN
jgi:glycosyltransferase involved in cell wall biosynthesis